MAQDAVWAPAALSLKHAGWLVPHHAAASPPTPRATALGSRAGHGLRGPRLDLMSARERSGGAAGHVQEDTLPPGSDLAGQPPREPAPADSVPRSLDPGHPRGTRPCLAGAGPGRECRPRGGVRVPRGAGLLAGALSRPLPGNGGRGGGFHPRGVDVIRGRCRSRGRVLVLNPPFCWVVVQTLASRFLRAGLYFSNLILFSRT